jgi:D-glycero-D-manno-heptose 1,7-bisphosphate phosphatase
MDYLGDPAGVIMLPGAAAAIGRLTSAGVPVVIVTNQSGIGRGFFTEADFTAVQERVEREIEKAGGTVLATYHCPHDPNRSPSCDCRKPGTGLFEQAAEEHDLDLASSAYVGDRMRDVEPGLRLGGSGYLIGNADWKGTGEVRNLTIVTSLAEAADRILGRGHNRVI